MLHFGDFNALVASLRARINEERILNRIDSNRLFFMNRRKVDAIWWKNTALGSIGKPCIVLEVFMRSEKSSISHNTRLTSTEESR